ncbi:MAG: metal ABC transporter permease, partial [Burkholderiales bacterium]
MSDALALLWLPFVLSIVLVAIHTFLGLQVLARNVVFVDLALAQIAALGATVAFMLGHPVSSSGSYAYSLAFTLAAAVVLASTRSWTQRVPLDALVGVIYVVAAAAAFLVVEKAPQGTEHIKQLLTGNILTTGVRDLAFVTPLYALVGFGLWAARARLARCAEGSSRWVWDFFFYACFGLVVTSSVALAGVLLVFSFLIIPAAIGMLYADGVRQLLIGWAVGVLASCVGLTASYIWDLPTGSAMVCTFGATLAIA